MRFTLTAAALQLLLLSNDSRDCFAAFAPFTSIAKKTSLLQATSDLNDPYANLLKSLSSTTPPPEPTIVVPDVVPDVVSNIVPPAVDSLNDAAAAAAVAATEAAEQALAAANSIQVPDDVSAATAAVAGGASTLFKAKASAAASSAYAVGGEKAPYLTDYIKQPKTFEQPNFDAVGSNAQEKLGIMFGNIIKSVDKKDAVVDPSAVLSGAAITTSPSVNQIIENFHFKEYASWYVTAGAVVLAFAQKNAGKEEAQREFDTQLAEAKMKAEKAAEAAAMAADQAAKSKELAAKLKAVEQEKPQGSGEDVLLDSRSKMLQYENEMMKKELKNVTYLTAQLKSQLDTLVKETALKSEQIATVEKTVTQPKIKVKETIPKDPTVILDIVKEIDSENAKKAEAKAATDAKTAKKTAATEKKAAVEAKQVAEKKAKAAADKKAAAEARKQAAADKKAKAAADKKAAAEAKKVAAAEKKAKAAADKKAKAAADKKVADEAEAEKIAAEARAAVEAQGKAEAEKIAAEAKAAAEAEVKAALEAEKDKIAAEARAAVETEAKASKTSKSNKKAKSKASAASEEDPHPWSKLAPSTLSRKTVKELSEFLSERGVSATDESGKALAKKELLSAVKENL